MLDNTITLSVDTTNDNTPENQAYTRMDESTNRSVYKSPTHSLVSKDTMTCTRNSPKKSGSFRGVAKTTVKFSTDVEVDTSEVGVSTIAPLIGTVSFSLPVGTTAAEAMVLRQRLIAALDDDDFMVRLTEELEI